jgi:hypothetical protein
MKRHFAAAIAIVLPLLVLPATASTQNTELGPMADVLQNRIGDWNVEIEFRPAATAKPFVSKATETSRLVGGKWLLSEFHGDMGGTPFNGIGLNGYDPKTGKYVGMWIDNLANAVEPTEGRYDPATKTFSTTSEEKSASGTRMVTSTTRTIDADTEVTTLETIDADGKPYTRMTMRMSRAR